MFKPRVALSPAMTRALMAIEADRQAMLGLPLDVAILASLRSTAKLLSTHYSTQIEGNRLTQAQVAEALEGSRFPGRERDEHEVRRYYAAMEWVEHKATESRAISERDIQTLHGLVLEGKAKPTPYRDGQNVIRDKRATAIVYLPPRNSKDVLRSDDRVALVDQRRESVADEWPVPVIAGMQALSVRHNPSLLRRQRTRTARLLYHPHSPPAGIRAQRDLFPGGVLRAQSRGHTIQSPGTSALSHNYYLGPGRSGPLPLSSSISLGGMADAFSRIRLARDGGRHSRGNRSIFPVTATRPQAAPSDHALPQALVGERRDACETSRPQPSHRQAARPGMGPTEVSGHRRSLSTQPPLRAGAGMGEHRRSLRTATPEALRAAHSCGQ